MSEIIERAINQLERLVSHPHAPALVESYFEGTHHFELDPTESSEPGFAGSSFLDLKPNHPHAISEADLLAVSLLDLPFRPTALRRLLYDQTLQTEVSRLLVTIPVSVPLWEATDEHLVQAEALWTVFQRLPYVGPVRAGKLLARKRPHLIPIVDQVVERVVRAPAGRYWSTFQMLLRKPGSIDAVGRICPHWVPENYPILRCLDVAIWMMGSNGEQVRRVRQEIIGDESPII